MPLHIAMLATELAPFVKVGGLADVLIGLSKSLVHLGCKVDIFIPYYRSINLDHLPFSDTFISETVEIKKVIYEKIQIFFVKPLQPDSSFNRDLIYGYIDDPWRFALFTKEALHFMEKENSRPDVIHFHDWQTALAPFFYDEMPNRFNWSPKFLFTIHNLAYQGHVWHPNLNFLGIFQSASLSMLKDPSQSHFNLLKGAVIRADHVTTVSKTYAKEIQTKEDGQGLDQVFKDINYKLTGILNGLDYHEVQKIIPIPQKVIDRNLEATFAFKQKMKQEIIEEFQLVKTSHPLLISVTRLAEQKGLPLIYKGAKKILEAGGLFFMIGSEGNLETQSLFRQLEKEFRETNRIKILYGYQPILAEKLFAAADMTLIPSYSEPCGLTQMYSLYFGTIPIVRETGGLADTIHDLRENSILMNQRNGFTFLHANDGGLDWAIPEALITFENKERWHMLMKNALLTDCSWKTSSKEYFEIYQNLLAK